MFGEILRFLLEIIFSLLGAALLARAWIYAVKLHPSNPISQAVHQATNWLVQPLRNLIPSGKGFDGASLVGAYLIAVIFLGLLWLIATGSMLSPKLIPSLLGAALVTVGRWAFNLIVWLTLIQAVLSWINPLAPIMPVLRTLTAPLLEPIKRIMPNLGGIDLSALVLLILAQIVLMVLNRVSFSLLGI